MRGTFSIVGLLLATGLMAQLNSSREKFLVVDPKGHNAVVNEIMYSPLTRELISVADDKTIRLWDLDDQALIEVELLSAAEGDLAPVALQPLEGLDREALAAADRVDHQDGGVGLLDLEEPQVAADLRQVHGEKRRLHEGLVDLTRPHSPFDRTVDVDQHPLQVGEQ